MQNCAKIDEITVTHAAAKGLFYTIKYLLLPLIKTKAKCHFATVQWQHVRSE